MSETSELDKLISEKKEIESKIRSLKEPSYMRCGSVRIHRSDDGKGDWQVAALTEYDKVRYEDLETYHKRTGRIDMCSYWDNRLKIYSCKSVRWWPFIRKSKKTDLLETMKEVCRDLQDVINKLENEMKETEDMKNV